MNKKKTQNKLDQTSLKLFTKFGQCFAYNVIAINFSQNSPHYSLWAPSNLKVVRALSNEVASNYLYHIYVYKNEWNNRGKIWLVLIDMTFQLNRLLIIGQNITH
jgi:hypothetical protein